MKKLFVITKYVVAKSAEEAIRLEKKQKVDECWLDLEWKRGRVNKFDSAFAFAQEFDNKKETKKL